MPNLTALMRRIVAALFLLLLLLLLLHLPFLLLPCLLILWPSSICRSSFFPPATLINVLLFILFTPFLFVPSFLQTTGLLFLLWL